MGNTLSLAVRLVNDIYNSEHLHKAPLFSTLFLFLFCMAIASSSYGQSISIQRASIEVGDLLNEITDQSGWNFSYAPQLIDERQRIPFRIRKASLEETLNLFCEYLDIAYTLLNQQIILHEKEKILGSEQSFPADAYFTLSGYVQDAQTGESLIGATVLLKETQQGVSTNDFGYYALRLPAGKYTLVYSYLGFEVQQFVVALAKNIKRDVSLKPTIQNLPGVLVDSNTKNNHISGGLASSGDELRPSDFSNLPEFAGESGLVRGLQTLAGIQAHSDGSAFFFVRGGDKDQNLIIIDDAPIYNPSHLFGFYSVIVPDFTKSIRVYKSDVPVHLGDRLSSIIDIRSRDGNLNKTEFGAAFHPLLFRLSLEGPIRKEKSSYFVSFRSSNFKWLYQKNFPEANIRFSDLNVKWNAKLNAKNRLYFTFFIGSDRYENTVLGEGLNKLGWENLTATLRWNHLLSEKLFVNTIFYTGNYNYHIGRNNNNWSSGIGRGSLKSDLTYYHRPDRKWRMGFELNGFSFNTGKISGDDWSELFTSIDEKKTQQTVLFINREAKWKQHWTLNTGLRYSIWNNLGPDNYFTFDEQYQANDSVVITKEGIYNSYHQLDPRIKIAYRIDSSAALSLSYGIYHQNLQLISNSISPFTAMDVWLPSSPNIKPQRAQQISFSFQKAFFKKGYFLQTELYYKNMRNQIEYANHANTILNPQLEGILRFGTLQSYGLECTFKKQKGRLNGWLNYSYARAIRQTPEVNNNRSYPAFQDRPHSFSLMLNYALKRRILFSAYWTIYSGSTFSSPTGFYTYNHRTIPIFDKKNNDRLPTYRRLDVAFKFVLNKKPDARFRHDLTFSIYNLLGHKNIVAVNFNHSLNDKGNPVIKANLLAESELVATRAYLLQFFPSLTYKMNL